MKLASPQTAQLYKHDVCECYIAMSPNLTYMHDIFIYYWMKLRWNYHWDWSLRTTGEKRDRNQSLCYILQCIASTVTQPAVYCITVQFRNKQANSPCGRLLPITSSITRTNGYSPLSYHLSYALQFPSSLTNQLLLVSHQSVLTAHLSQSVVQYRQQHQQQLLLLLRLGSWSSSSSICACMYKLALFHDSWCWFIHGDLWRICRRRRTRSTWKLSEGLRDGEKYVGVGEREPRRRAGARPRRRRRRLRPARGGAQERRLRPQRPVLVRT